MSCNKAFRKARSRSYKLTECMWHMWVIVRYSSWSILHSYFLVHWHVYISACIITGLQLLER